MLRLILLLLISAPVVGQTFWVEKYDRQPGPKATAELVGKYEAQVIDGDTVKNGASENYFMLSGNIKEKGFFRNNLKNGVFQSYYENGNLRWERTYRSDTLVGKEAYYDSFGQLLYTGLYEVKDSITSYKQYYPNGHIQASFNLINGEKSGKLTQFQEEKEEVLSEFHYENDQKNGPFIVYNTDGVLVQEGTYSHNVLNDSLKNYYDNGSLKNSLFFIDGKVNGTAISYYPNTAIKEIANYTLDTLHGKSFSYSKEGTLLQSSKFHKGVPHDTLYKYYDQGSLESMIVYSYGKLNGPYTLYYENGDTLQSSNYIIDYLEGNAIAYYSNHQIKFKLNYNQGQLTGKNFYYYENGQLEKEIIFKDSKHKKYAKEYFNNGTLKQQSKYKYKVFENSKNESVEQLIEQRKSFNSQGNLVAKGSLVDMKKEGKWQTYYDDKTIKSKELYKNNVLRGEQLYFDEQGKLRQKANYKSGKRHGLTYWYVAKEVSKEINYRNDIKHGLYKEFDNGQLIVEGTYRTGRKQGKWLFYKDNQLVKEETYKQGELVK